MQRNREFSKTYQGKFFREQAIFTYESLVKPPLRRIKFWEATEVPMQSFRLAAIPTIAITSLLLILAPGYSGFAQTPAPPPTLAPPLISLAEARAIIDGAVLALWLAGRDVNELESTRMKLDLELDEALEETFSASDPPSITREP